MRLHPIIFSLALIGITHTGHASATHTFHIENVLGSSLELQVEAASAEEASLVQQSVLDEIERLSRVLSTWSPDSELSKAQASHGKPVAVSDELFTFLQQSEAWQKRSQQLFNPRVAELISLWKEAEQKQQLPSSTQLQEVTSAINKPAWELDATKRTVTFKADTKLTFDAYAKGWIIDRAGEASLARHTSTRNLLVNLGGDIRHWGSGSPTVAIADPRNAAENATPIITTQIHQQAIATSGGYRRGWDIQGAHYSHILDPRNGLPVESVTSASVMAPDTATADVLATLFSIMAPEESIAFASTLKDVECFLVTSNGQAFRSLGWRNAQPAHLFLADAGSKAVSTDNVPAAAAGSAMECQVDFEVSNPGAKKYHRPYVAVWIEDENDFPVRTLLLWIQQNKEGLKWLRDLKRWHRSDKTRQVIDPTDLVETVSSATRRPGQYNVIWDGKDDLGAAVKSGTYTLYIEAAREEGTYQIIKHNINWGSEAYLDLLEGNIEIGSAAVEIRAKQAK